MALPTYLVRLKVQELLCLKNITRKVCRNFSSGVQPQAKCVLSTSRDFVHRLPKFQGARTLIFSKSNLFQNSRVVCPPCGELFVRHKSGGKFEYYKGTKTQVIYICAVGIFMLGMTYAGVPLYRLFCQATGLGGKAVKGHDTNKVETMSAVKNRIIRVRFNADTASSMRWNFKPQQTEVKVMPGETALAFYTAENPTDKPIIGISTYNVVPFDAGQYFNKIQCFCFEEQRLNPHEQVDMPVFFYIDPDYAEDPKLERVDLITLSYTFFEVKEGMVLPLPGYATTAPAPV